jgi:hypothetical protein
VGNIAAIQNYYLSTCCDTIFNLLLRGWLVDLYCSDILFLVLEVLFKVPQSLAFRVNQEIAESCLLENNHVFNAYIITR